MPGGALNELVAVGASAHGPYKVSGSLPRVGAGRFRRPCERKKPLPASRAGRTRPCTQPGRKPQPVSGLAALNRSREPGLLRAYTEASLRCPGW
jgi:hypothetical protein